MSDKEGISQKFKIYLKNNTSYNKSKINSLIRYAIKFLTTICKTNTFQSNFISPENIHNYLITSRPTKTNKISQTQIYYLRVFLKYLFISGKIKIQICNYIPNVPRWRQSYLPCFLSNEEIQKILIFCKDDHSFAGYRNLVIILLFIRLGLRAKDVFNLTIDDFNWKNGEIKIHSKNGIQEKFPLPCDLGEAIVTYLKKRPSFINRKLIIKTKPPYHEFKYSTSISQIAKSIIVESGVITPKAGSHIFRHTFAADLLKKGANLYEIGELLRHKSINTTSIYAKVDFNRLKTICQSWPVQIKEGI